MTAHEALRPAVDEQLLRRRRGLDAGGDRAVRVLAVDNEEIVHWGLRVLLSAEPWVERCLSACTVDAAIELARRYKPHVALVELLVGDDPGVALCERLAVEAPATRVLLMSGTTPLPINAARRTGAAGFVPKGWPAKAIAGAVRVVSLGMTVYPPLRSQPPTMLSGREWDVLRLLAEGATNRQAGERLFLSTHTIKSHTRSLYRKLGARNRAEAILNAQRIGLVT